MGQFLAVILSFSVGHYPSPWTNLFSPWTNSARRPRAPQTLEITTKSKPNINFDISAISGPILEILFFNDSKFNAEIDSNVSYLLNITVNFSGRGRH